MSFKYLYTFLFLAAFGCNRLPYTAKVGGQLNTLDTSWTSSNAKIEALIAPYKNQIDSQMNQIIGYAANEMIKQRPESALGNGIADLLYRYGVDHVNSSIDLCVLNYGGLRAPLSKGPITVGRVFEIMPFDNTLVVVELNRDEMKALASHILTKSGEPIGANKHVAIVNYKSGAVFEFEDEALHNQDTYTILTSNYLADGGDGYSVFKEKSKEDSNILIRTAMIAEFSKTSQSQPFTAEIDGRIIWDPNK